MNGNDQLDLHLDFEDDDDDFEPMLPTDSGDRSACAEEFQWSSTLNDVEIELFTCITGPKLENTDLQQSSFPIESSSLAARSSVSNAK